MVLAYAAVAALVWYFQERLLFFPQPLPESAARLRAWPRAEELSIPAADGTRLHGWFLRGAGPRSGVILYFGGNADEASRMAEAADLLPDWSWALVNYRGYGLSGGKPGERELYADALAVYDHLRGRSDVDPERMAAFGRSLGSGMAVYLAAHRPLRAVILHSPYSSVEEVARGAYPWLPVRLLLRHRFDSMRWARGLRLPALILIAEADRIIPPHLSRRLAQAWGGEKEVLSIPGAGHDFPLDAGHWGKIRDFLAFPAPPALPAEAR